MRLRPLVLLTALFCGLAAAFGGLNLAARGRPAAAAWTSAAGLGLALAAAALLSRDPGRG